jgi:hypothetical protein
VSSNTFMGLAAFCVAVALWFSSCAYTGLISSEEFPHGIRWMRLGPLMGLCLFLLVVGFHLLESDPVDPDDSRSSGRKPRRED